MRPRPRSASSIERAERGRGRTTPNPLVGAVVVKDGEVLGEGFHSAYGAPHAERGYCTVLTGSTQFGRALAEPEEVPEAIAYYDELERRSDVVYRVSPLSGGEPVDGFSFDFSFNAYPLSYVRPGPEIVIRRLRDGEC